MAARPLFTLLRLFYPSLQNATSTVGSTDAKGGHSSSVDSSWLRLLLLCRSRPPTHPLCCSSPDGCGWGWGGGYGTGGGLRSIRFSSGYWIIGAGKMGAVLFVLVDTWLLFFSNKVNIMAYIRRKSVCRSAVNMVETHYFGVNFSSFSVFWWL